ncbi:MAG: minor capsid protein [Firmicutes bacterium]|nr:minor capsid protein [Bacillota bacterium]
MTTQNIDVKFKWNIAPIQWIKNNITKNESSVTHMAVTWHKLYFDFVPFDNGDLAKNIAITVKNGNNASIAHTMPYAHWVYDGTKRNKGIYKKRFHPLASKEWDKAAKAAGRDKKLLEEMKKYIKGK